MQAGISLSSQSLQFSHTSYTQFNVQQKNAKEVTNNQSNNISKSTINEDRKGQTSSISTNTTLANDTLNDFQKTILNKALGAVAQIKEEMLKTWEEVFFKTTKTSNNKSNLELMLNSQFEQKVLGNGISLSQGFSGSLEISIQGTIITNDGTKHKLDLSIGISQSFMQNLQLNTTNASTNTASKKNVIDPLVIDYAGNGTELSDSKMHFDLDSDGTPNQIATLKEGSGFLALDKNNDGKINNGNELFGTKSGDGFRDLSKYDSNSDGKIDKEDPIFDKLRIWTPDSNGEGKLVGLGEKGIGVIYLNPKESQELMQGDNGDLLGIKRKSADFLFNNGNNGKIHHIDLVSERTKDESLHNQAEAILSNKQGAIQILAEKTYQGLETNFNQSFLTSNTGILNEILHNINSTQISSLAVNIFVSFSSLQNGKNGVSIEVSQMWAKLESSFNAIEMQNTMHSLLENFDSVGYTNLNHLLFDAKDSKNTWNLYNLNSTILNRLLCA